MAQYIDKDALIAEIDKRLSTFRESFLANMNAPITIIGHQGMWTYTALKDIVDTLEVKEVDLDVMQRIEECPYRRVGCTMYEGKILECKGACSWVVDYPRLKELKAQKGE